MFKSVLAFGLACFVFASAADAAPRATLPMPTVPASSVGADLQDAGHHRSQRQYRSHGHNRHHYRPHRQHYHHAPRVHRGFSQAHYRWCAAKYRSYKRHSNTWTAYSGKVHQCRSPY